MPRLTPADARAILSRCLHNPLHAFHELRSSEVEALLVEADARRYRSPRHANGSRGRYWHAHLRRVADRAGS